jgi:hypothetical protein
MEVFTLRIGLTWHQWEEAYPIIGRGCFRKLGISDRGDDMAVLRDFVDA